MADVLVVADDLSGGNATGALFVDRRLRVVGTSATRDLARLAADADVLIVDAGTRCADAEQAASGVDRAVREAGAGARLLIKRIDSTLRGLLGAELQAALSARASVTGKRTYAIAAPAYPQAGRTTVGGIQLVEGRPLADSVEARDLLTPVADSRAGRLLTTGTPLRWREIHIDVLRSGEDAVVRLLEDTLADTGAVFSGGAAAPVLVLDAADDRDLRTGAAATARLVRAGWDIVSVDPGPFGVALADELGLLPPGPDGGVRPVLIVAASASERTAVQLTRASAELGAVLVDVGVGDPTDIVADNLVAQLHRAVDSSDAAAIASGWRVVPGRVTDVRLARRLVEEIAAAAEQVIARGSVHAVFATGGDMAAAVLAALKADGVAVDLQVQPLVAAGHLIGGPYDGLPFATKGGSVGTNDAVAATVAQLRAKPGRLDDSEREDQS